MRIASMAELATILVTGLPGAGKTTVAARLATALECPVAFGRAGEGAEIDRLVLSDAATVLSASVGGVLPSGLVVIEDDALAPIQLAGGLRLAVVDGVGFADAQELAAPLVRAADVVLVTRGDVIDLAPVMTTLARMTQAPVLDATRSEPEDWVSGPPRGAPAAPAIAFVRWGQTNTARMRAEDVDRMLETRPEGVFRLNGVLRTDKGGQKVDVVGRTRQVRACRQPEASILTASGPSGVFRPDDLALHVAEFWASGASFLGLFGHR